jgi:hypothetical protein
MAALSNSEWISLASGVVALCAFGVSLWQGHVSSKHNRLSARPLLKIDFHAKDDEVSCSLINVGLGPAFLDELLFSISGKDYDFFSNSFVEFVDRFRSPLLNETNFYVHRVPRGTVISANESFLIFKTVDDTLMQAHLDKVNVLLPQMQFMAKYRSMYGERFGSD